MSGAPPQATEAPPRPMLASVGAAVFAASVLVGVLIWQGVGQRGCGLYGLNCPIRSFFWLMGTQALAAALLWPGAMRLARASWPRRFALAGAVISSLAVLFGLLVLSFVVQR